MWGLWSVMNNGTGQGYLITAPGQDRRRADKGEGPALTTVERSSRGRAAATVERVLPWRRQGPPAPDFLGPLLAAYRERHPKGDASLIVKAYETAEKAHDGQFRRSGEAFISHPVAVATVLAGLGMDDVTLAAALLHDSVEDTRGLPGGDRGRVSAPSWPR